MIRDILLQLSSYPEPTPEWAIDQAAAIADLLDARLSSALCQIHFPRISNFLADKLVHANQVIARENAISRHDAKRLLEAFAARVPVQRRGDQHLIDCRSLASPWQLAAQARAFDLTIVPVHGHPDTRAIAEGLAFESGRPLLMITEQELVLPPRRIVIGWDGGRAAARALADALPFCRLADAVQLATVTGEKQFAPGPAPAAIRDHLRAHGVDAELVELPAAGRDAGSALQLHCIEADADLLVAGAYGHSRVREFVLGGATRTILDQPSLSSLLSH